MGSFLDAIKSKQATDVSNQNHLSTQEIEFLLILIKNSNFKGEQLETIYNIVLKLQGQYINQTNKK